MQPRHIFILQLVIIQLLTGILVSAQIISAFTPKETRQDEMYLFYLHGQVVTDLGNNAVNQSVPEWGPYEYLNILDSLKKRGFNIISEIRQKGVANAYYEEKVSRQIDTLINRGVKATSIVIVGASAGWDIALRVSSKLKNRELSFVIMGGCWQDTHKEYQNLALYGRFLSIIEKSDPHGTCSKIFTGRKLLKNYQEIILNTGLSHGFIYKGYKEWINPIVNWMKNR